MSSKSLFMSNFKFKKNKNHDDQSSAYKTAESLQQDSLDTTLNTTLDTINDATISERIFDSTTLADTLHDLPSFGLHSQHNNENLHVLASHVLSADQITIHKEIGKGEFGVVQQGIWTNEKGERIQVAIKCLSKQRMHNNSMEFLKEAAIMHSIAHPHIVRLFGVVLDGNSLMLVTELAPLRSLLECLRDQSIKLSLTVSSVCDFALQICNGMQYLEKNRLIHRDLAARNILVFTKSLVKISDFGLSRALGVGKDYYQISMQNYNESLKLPIAWCAPECVTYFKFTSSSDVWSYAVTLWELFSYGYEPWIGFEGKEIIAAIDEPNYQRLEQPDYCPKDYYSIMLRCWEHDPAKRPKFSEIINMLPDCKPELVQAVKDCTPEQAASTVYLQFKVGDVITVLDKSPTMPHQPTGSDLLSTSIKTLWKGCLNDGKVGLFNPNLTVSYLGQNLPNRNAPTSPTSTATNHHHHHCNFTQNGMKLSVFIKSFLERTNSQNQQQNCSKKKIRPEMISKPQDLQHTTHVGIDGAFFGDISYLPTDKYQLIPNKQNDSSYKPINGSLDKISLSRNSSDMSDKTPLLNSNSKDTFKDSLKRNTHKLTLNTNGTSSLTDHEYHEISEDETPCSPKSKPFDFGPSLLEAVLKDLKQLNFGSSTDLDKEFNLKNSNMNEKTDKLTDKSDKASSATTTLLPTKKKQANLKPISAAEQKSLDSAIAMVLNHFDSKDKNDSLTLLDNCSMTADSPRFSVTSPTKKKFTFKFTKSSNKEQKTFSDQLNTKQSDNIVDGMLLPENGKEAYESLVESGSLKKQRKSNKTIETPTTARKSGYTSISDVTSKVTSRSKAIFSKNISRNSLPKPPPIPCKQPPAQSSAIQQATNSNSINGLPSSQPSSQPQVLITNLDAHQQNLLSAYPPNPLPLPPRSDRTKSLIQLKHHERRHALVIPDTMDGSDILNSLQHASNNKMYYDNESKPKLMSTFKPNMPLHRNVSFNEATHNTANNQFAMVNSSPAGMNSTTQCVSNVKDQPQRCSQIPIEMMYNGFNGLPIVKEGECRTPGLNKDIVEFKFENQNIKIDVGKLRQEEPDEVRLMQKVLAHKVSSDECLAVLKKCNWDVFKSIKVIQLRETLKQQSIVSGDEEFDWIESVLKKFNWHVRAAVSHFVAQQKTTNGATAV